MPSIETSIWLALKARVSTLVLSPALQVAYPKEAFTPPQSGNPVKLQPYLEIRHLPNANQRAFIGHDEPHIWRGILQVTLKYPVATASTQIGIAEATQQEIAGQIAAHFPAGLQMPHSILTAHVEKAPDVAQSFRDGADPYWQTPVSIRYWCEA